MKELNDYLEWCDSQYKNCNHCHCGVHCKNGNYCSNTRQANCYPCIKIVHSYKNNSVHYNCDKMLYYYVLKHCYRFAAEIFYEFQRLCSDLNNWDEIYILSIGCGPSTELFGAMLQWRKMDKHDMHFHYRGFDTEALWQPFMNKVCSSFTDSDVEADNNDAFIYYQTHHEKVDVIVLNYMLSDMFKFQNSQYDQFLANLINLSFRAFCTINCRISCKQREIGRFYPQRMIVHLFYHSNLLQLWEKPTIHDRWQRADSQALIVQIKLKLRLLILSNKRNPTICWLMTSILICLLVQLIEC